MEMNPNQYYKKGQQKSCYHQNSVAKAGKKNGPQQVVYQKKEEQLQAVTKQQTQDCQQNGWQSLTVGNNGPVLAEDVLLHETLAEFIHQPAPERAVHNKGYGAFGTFTVYQSMAPYTKACFLQTPGQKIDTFSRFSLAVSNKGTADTSRNVRGFSTKFYTQEGVFDLLCNHIPVFLVRDGIKFPAAIQALRPSLVNNLPCSNQFWQFVAENPESMNFTTMLYSDLGTLDDMRCMRSYGVNTYLWENACGQQYYVKYHWVPLGQMTTIDRETAIRLAGENPHIAGEKLYNTLAQGKAVQFDLCVQLLAVEQAEQALFDPLDATKVWPEEQYPLTHVGRLTLDRNVDCYAEQVEKAAFSPANLVDGIGFSNDRLLQGRVTVYGDAQRHRLGKQFRKMAINRQNCWTTQQISENVSLGNEVNGMVQRQSVVRMNDFAQAGVYYRGLCAEQQAHLVDNIAVELWQTSCSVQEQVLSHFQQADVTLARQLEEQIGWYREQSYSR